MCARDREGKEIEIAGKEQPIKGADVTSAYNEIR